MFSLARFSFVQIASMTITNNVAPTQGAISGSTPSASQEQIDTASRVGPMDPFAGGVEDLENPMVSHGSCMRISSSMMPKAPAPTVICRMGGFR